MSVNSVWKTQMGGELYIEDESIIVPQIGTAVIFHTPGVWHEVLPVSQGFNAFRKTLALFAWQMDYNCDGQTSANFGDINAR